jgi:hypothetical protein
VNLPNFGTSKIMVQNFLAKKKIEFFGTSINKPVKAFTVK